MFHDDDVLLLLSISKKPILLPLENPYPRPRVRVGDFYLQKTPVTH